DYFDGPTLEDFVRVHGPIRVTEFLPAARLLAEGLHAAHGRGILHRDVKPANLLVKRDGDLWRVKLIDFGLALKPELLRVSLAATAGGRTASALAAQVAGTLDYAAPEQLGRLPGVAVGPAADVFGFARTCCYALFGTPQPLRKHWAALPEKLADL